MLLLYVDDMIISSLDPAEGTKFLNKIKLTFEIGEEGDLDWYIGMAVKDNGNSIKLSQSHYVTKAVEKYGYDKKTVAESPMRESYAIERKPSDELFEEENLRSKIGTLMYTNVCVRPVFKLLNLPTHLTLMNPVFQAQYIPLMGSSAPVKTPAV
jgi:hypothetical protein